MDLREIGQPYLYNKEMRWEPLAAVLIICDGKYGVFAQYRILCIFSIMFGTTVHRIEGKCIHGSFLVVEGDYNLVVGYRNKVEGDLNEYDVQPVPTSPPSWRPYVRAPDTILVSEEIVCKMPTKVKSKDALLVGLTKTADSDDPNECSICLEYVKQWATIPCGHLYCSQCAAKIRDSQTKQCFICRCEVKDFLKVFN